MTQNKRYAITGGIGSGKSAFSKILRETGYPVFSCDDIYAELCGEAEYLNALKKLFPDCVADGVVNRAALSQKVFSDRAELAKLNALSHPMIMRRLFELTEREPVSFSEVPLLFEGGYETQFDGVIVLVRGEEERIKSVMARNGLTEDAVRARLANQFDERLLAEKNCVIVKNDGSLADLKQSAKRALRDLGIA